MQRNVSEGGSDKVQKIIDNVTNSISGLIELLQNSKLKMEKLNYPERNPASIHFQETSLDPNLVGFNRSKRLLNMRERNAMTYRHVKRQRSTIAGESQGLLSSSYSSSSSSLEESDGTTGMSFLNQRKENKSNWIVNRFMSEMPPLIKRPKTCEHEEQRNVDLIGRKRKILSKVLKQGINEKIDGEFTIKSNKGLAIKTEGMSSRNIDRCNKMSAKGEEETERVRLEKELLGTWRIKINPEMNELDLRKCSACQDTFYLDIGFKEHLKRRTVQINYTCHDCKSNLEFFNRCQLILHIQMHGKKANIDNVYGVTKTQPLAMSEIELHLEYTEELEKKEKSKLQDEENEGGIEIIGNGNKEETDGNIEQEFDKNTLVKSHSLSEASTILEFQDDDDWLSKMSNYDKSTNNLQTTGNLKQFWNINPTVLVVEKSETLEDFGEIEILKSQNQISVKIEEQVMEDTSDNETCEFLKGLEKCQFCTKLVLPSVWKHHEKQCGARMTDILRGYCVTCKKDFQTVGRLAKHGLKDHCKDGNQVCIFCNNKSLNFQKEGSGGNTNNLKNHLFQSHAYKRKEFPYNCELCEDVCKDRKKMGEHLVLHQRNLIPITKGCEEEGNEFGNKTELLGNTNAKEIIVSYCPPCKGKEFNNLKLLERHLNKVHGITLETKNLKKLSMRKITGAKKFAGVLINQGDEISNQSKSLEEKSGSFEKNSSLSPNLQIQGKITKEPSNPTKFYSRPFASPFYKRRQAKRSSQEVTSLNEKLIVTNDKQIKEESILPFSRARKEDGTLVCLKCKEYETNSEVEFFSHVKSTHVWSLEDILNRSVEGGAEKSDFWCPECDTTFSSKSALRMHLKVNHEFIRDVKYYLEQLGYEGEIPLLENQCEVCFLYCENTFALQKHFRSHGLAFLRMQQERRNKIARVKQQESTGNKELMLIT